MSAPPLPPELERFGDELVAAAARRAPARARAARRLRVVFATLVAALGATSLAAATGLVPTPWDDAPRAVVYTVTADGGRGESVTCRERDGAARCRTDVPTPPVAQLAATLAERGATTGRIDLVRLCGRGAGAGAAGGGCRTLPSREAGRAVGDGELLWVTTVGLRPAARGERVTLFTPEASRGARDSRATLTLEGGPLGAEPVTCLANPPQARICQLVREHTTRGVLDTDALLAAAGATAYTYESGRLCPLTGNRACRAIRPETARALAADPARLERRGLAVVYTRQVTARGFASVPARPQKPRRR